MILQGILNTGRKEEANRLRKVRILSTLIGRQLTWQTNIRLSELVGDIRQSASHVKGGEAPAKRGADYGRFACTKILIEFASEMLTLLWNVS